MIPVKVSGIKFTSTGNKLISQWHAALVHETITIEQLYKLAEDIITENASFASIKQDALFLVSSHKQTSLGIQEHEKHKQLCELFPQISEDHHIVVWAR